jgi:hypothetical protein
VLVMTGAGFYDRYARWTIAAGDFLTMAPKVQFGGVTVVGRQSTLDPSEVTLDNGIIKIGQTAGTHTFQVTLPGATSSDWGTPWSLDLGYWNGLSFTTFGGSGFYAARVTRDDPQICSVRWSHYSAGAIIHIDVSLRRGAAHAEMVISQESAYTDGPFGIWQPACQTVVKTDRALRSGAIEDNYRMILCDTEGTSDAAAGMIYSASNVDQLRVGVGVALEGGSATSENVHGVIKEQFYAGQMITERFSGVRQ